MRVPLVAPVNRCDADFNGILREGVTLPPRASRENKVRSKQVEDLTYRGIGTNA